MRSQTPDPARPPRPAALRPALVAAAAGVVAPLLLASPAHGAPGDCRAASSLVSLGEMTGAVALYDRARDDGQACGGSAAAEQARARLAGEPATEEQAPMDPFAAAEELARLGRDDDARDAALAAVREGAAPPEGSRSEELLSQGWADRVRLAVTRWLESWWAMLALGIALVVVGMAMLARRAPARRLQQHAWFSRIPPRLCLAVTVENASGTQPDVEAGFAVQVRTRVREVSARYARDPRVVYGSDAPVDVPLDAVPGQAKYLAALWRWFARSNTVTLRVTLLPASREGVGCHVVLLERNGGAVRGGRLSEQVLWHRPSHWRFDLSGEPSWHSLQWMPLANLVTAWALYAFRSLQASPEMLEEEFGTRSGQAYAAMLAGLEEEDSPQAMRHFRDSLEVDEHFVEARLNLASALSNSTLSEPLRTEALTQAQGLLDKVRERVEPAADNPGRDRPDRVTIRWRGLWFRTLYSQIMLQFNRLAPLLGDTARRDDAREEVRSLLTTAQTLNSWVHAEEPVDGTGQLGVLKRQMEPHVRLMLAGALDLSARYSNPPAAPLPIDLEVPECARMDDHQRQAVAIMREIPMNGTALRIHYTMACTWARDIRLRPAEPADQYRAALMRCAERLDAAVADRGFLERWRHDPDLEPIAGSLDEALTAYRRNTPRRGGPQAADQPGQPDDRDEPGSDVATEQSVREAPGQRRTKTAQPSTVSS